MNDPATLTGIAQMGIVLVGFCGGLLLLDRLGALVQRWMR